MDTFEEKLTALNEDGEEIHVVARVASIQRHEGRNLVKDIRSVSISVNIPVDDRNQFVHPENGKTYTVNLEHL